MEPAKDFLYDNDIYIVKKITGMLRWLLCAFPLMLLFIASGEFYLSYRHFFWMSILSTIVVLIPTVMLKLKAPIGVMKYATVLAPTIIVGILATEIHVVIYICFALGIVISLLYHNKKLTFWTTFYSYFIVVASVGVRSFSIENEDQFHYWIATSIGYLIEICAMGFVAMKVAEDSRSMLEKLYHAKIAAEQAEKRARQSDRLREEKRIAVRANRAKSEFLANMSHEIRTPIHAIMGMNEMVLRESKEPAILEYAEDIQDAGDTLLSIVNDILDFSKIESGKIDLQEKQYSLQQLLSSVTQMIGIKLRQKELEFKLDIDETLPAALMGDELRLRQIMLNLLNNAVKYTHKGSVSFRVWGEEADGSFWLNAEIKDTGVGIKKEDMSKLFYMFERLDMKKNRNIEGTGLGLVITKKLVDAMNGTVTAESVYGLGSVFTIRVPQRVCGSEKLGVFTRAKSMHCDRQRKYQASFLAPAAEVLVVDDNEMNLTVVKNLLKKTQVQITLCDSGAACLQMTAKKYFDVILLDHMMPGLDGIETLHCLRDAVGNPCRKVPVIALTANAMADVREMYLKEGFDDYISKPVRSDLLEQTLKHFIPQEKLLTEKTELQQPAPQHEAEAPAEKKELVNREMGLSHCGNDPAIYHEMLHMYSDLQLAKEKKLQELLEQKDWKNYGIEMHALKSTSLTLGGEQASEAAKELELAAKRITAQEPAAQEDAQLIIEKHARVMVLYRKTAKEAERILQELDVAEAVENV